MLEDKKIPDKPQTEKSKSRFIGVNNSDKKEISSDAPLKDVIDKDIQIDSINKNDSIKELLEKNLKWSQIIYEQNRKIKRALTWSAVGSWIRIFIFLVPFILAAWYLWPMYKSTQFQLLDMLTDEAVLKNISSTSTPDNSALKSLLKVMPLSETQQKQIDTLIDNNNNTKQQ